MAVAFTSTTHRLALILLLLVTFSSPLCFAKCHVDDEAGLLAFKSGITHDPSGLLSSWIPGTDCCRWSGVRCINTDRVTQLSLHGDENSSLAGTISPSLFLKVRQLSRISIESHPEITGTLPTEIFNLPTLKYVSIRFTKLSGLLRIDIGPKSDRFKQLSLIANQFTGTIPSSISQFSHLVALDLNDNKFSGEIPYDIRRLTKLTHLALENNKLSGRIPDFFKSFGLIEVDLSNNSFSGGIPPSISFLGPQVAFFRLNHNALTGRIPDISNFGENSGLDLSYNHLSGPIPPTKLPIESFIGNDGLCGSPLPPCKKY